MAHTEVPETREKVKDSIDRLIADVEDLLRVGPEALNADVRNQCSKLRSTLISRIGNIKGSVSDLENRALGRYRQATATTGAYLYGHPWQSIGLALLSGAIVAVLVSRRGLE